MLIFFCCAVETRQSYLLSTLFKALPLDLITDTGKLSELVLVQLISCEFNQDGFAMVTLYLNASGDISS